MMPMPKIPTPRIPTPRILATAVCLLALTIFVGAYAESKTSEATELNKVLHAELFAIGDGVSDLEKANAEFVSGALQAKPDELLKLLASMTASANQIEQKTINPDARKIAAQIKASIAKLDPPALAAETARPAVLPDNIGVLIADLAGNHRAFVFAYRLSVERASALGHD